VVALVVAPDEQPVAPLTSSSFARSIPPNGLNAEPVPARQREQWQFSAYSNPSGTR
jgi:hypothetical protein